MQRTMELSVPSFINDFPNRRVLLPFVTISCLYCFFGLIHGLINKTHGRFITIHHLQHLHKRLTEQNNLFSFFQNVFSNIFSTTSFPSAFLLHWDSFHSSQEDIFHRLAFLSTMDCNERKFVANSVIVDLTSSLPLVFFLIRLKTHEWL